MRVYFDKEGLIESREFYTDKKIPYSLFSSISSVYPFVKFENELANINDYCFFILLQLEDKLKTLINDSDVPFELINGYRQEKEYSAEEIEDMFDPAYMFTPVITWEKLSHDINKCTLLMLILSYLETSLNEIAKWFCEERAIPLGRKEKGSNEITFYLEKISQCCDCNLIKVLEDEMVYLNMVRKIRNQFVHKAWDQVEERYNKFRLCDVINVTSVFFTEIEKAACTGGIIEEDLLFADL